MTVYVKYYVYNFKCNIKEGVKMTFAAYIERQKSIIRNRHEGEMFLIRKDEIIQLTESDMLLNELSSFKGLNTDERMAYRKVL